MTRLSIASEDVLGENYTITNIIASNYNPTIDTDITVTITVTDVYGDEVANKYVTTTCNIGKFTKLNGQTISDTQSVTAQTDNDGEISLTYTCSEWGLVTFSAKNHNGLQIHVTGYKLIKSTTNDLIKLYRNDNQIQCVLFSSTNDVYFGTSWAEYVNEGWIPTGLTPKSTIVATNYANLNTFWAIKGNGSISKRTSGSAAVTTQSYVVIEWSV